MHICMNHPCHDMKRVLWHGILAPYGRISATVAVAEGQDNRM